MNNAPQVTTDQTADPAVVGRFDLNSTADLGIIRRACTDALQHKPRWNITEEFRDALVVGLKHAHAAASASGNIRLMDQITQTAVKMVAMNQADEIAADRNARLDAGKPTENVALTEYRVIFDNEANGG